MKLLIDIPKEFEQHFQADRFEDSLNRLNVDAHLLAGNYEQETAVMLIEAFKNAVSVPPRGRLIDADALMLRVNMHGTNKFGMLDEDIRQFIEASPTVIEAEGDNNG